MRRALALCALLGCADEKLNRADPGHSGRADASVRDAAPAARDADPPLDPEDAAVVPDDAEVAERDASQRDAAADAGAACPRGTACNPFEINELPYRGQGDTRDGRASDFDVYACDDADESGPEAVYRLEVAEAGLLTVGIEEEPRDDADVDVHLLAGAADPEACIARDHVQLGAVVAPGTYFIVVDTWVNAEGEPQPGPYTLVVDLRAQPAGDCAFRPVRQEMVWNACSPGIDGCVEDGGDVFLELPASGPVVKEAHLVTVADDFGGGWPMAFTDGIEAHYALSQAASGYDMERAEPWAPAGEGGSEYGQSAYSRPLPVLDEAWYVNMYWRRRPPPGTRMIVLNPANGRAVVAAGGYETGPGSNEAIGGVTEEIHHHLGTRHRSTLVLGFAADEDLPLGPIDCER